MTLLLALLAALLAAAPAEAHLLGDAAHTAFAGFAHPFSGLDHVLAMLAVGLWAAQQGRPAIYVLPLAFPAIMVIGVLLGMSGVALPAVETAIAASVVVLGLMIVVAMKPSLFVGSALVSIFALFHGHAHGTELPDATSPLGYAVGFVAATLILHLAGLALGSIGRLPIGARAMRLAGSAIAVAGVMLLAP